MSDLGPMPEPEIEPGEPEPGGADAVDGGDYSTTPDPPVGDNPNIAEKVPEPIKEEVSEGEDTSTKATEAANGTNADEPRRESPA